MAVRTWVGIGVILLICALLIVSEFAAYRPARERLEAIRREVAIAENEFVYVAGHAADFERIREFLPDVADESGGGEQVFLSKISEELQRLGMVLTQVEPRRVQPYASYTKRTYRLDMEGGYREFANFMRYLETMPEVVTIDSFELNSRLLRRNNRHGAKLTITVIGQ